MIKILLLEDDYLYKISIKEFLEELDFIVDDFDNGEDALNAIFDKKYDLLLLDIRVPKMDGFELVKHVREASIDTPNYNFNFTYRYKRFKSWLYSWL